jgi:hypothetical protein
MSLKRRREYLWFVSRIHYLSKRKIAINNETRESIREFWDLNMGVCFVQDVPYIIHWELFCNENKDASPRLQDRNKTKGQFNFIDRNSI